MIKLNKLDNIYLDNAATSFPKAPGLGDFISKYIDNFGVNINRGFSSLSYEAENIVYNTRESLCEFFNFDDPSHVVFTKNITESLNIIMLGLLKESDHVIVSSMEHNAVVRPLKFLNENGIKYTKIQCNKDGELNPEDILKTIRKNTKALFITHSSNVSGKIFPLKRVGEICKEYGIYFIIDTAQTAGFIPIDFYDLNANAITFTGHKGLLGPQGIGGFLIDFKLNNKIKPLCYGGTGSFSHLERQPSTMPDKYESGTLNIPGIAGLNFSLNYIKSIGLDYIRDKEIFLLKKFIDGVMNIKDLKIAGSLETNDRCPVLSVYSDMYDISEIAYKLSWKYGISTRVGLHCSPWSHMTLGTFPQGTIRFSFGHKNTEEQIDYVLSSLYEVMNDR